MCPIFLIHLARVGVRDGCFIKQCFLSFQEEEVRKKYWLFIRWNFVVCFATVWEIPFSSVVVATAEKESLGRFESTLL